MGLFGPSPQEKFNELCASTLTRIFGSSIEKSMKERLANQFLDLAKAHKKNKKSFVVVATDIDFNKVPTSITTVPSLLEAHDIIEMEEIERELLDSDDMDFSVSEAED